VAGFIEIFSGVGNITPDHVCDFKIVNIYDTEESNNPRNGYGKEDETIKVEKTGNNMINNDICFKQEVDCKLNSLKKSDYEFNNVCNSVTKMEDEENQSLESSYQEVTGDECLLRVRQTTELNSKVVDKEIKNQETIRKGEGMGTFKLFSKETEHEEKLNDMNKCKCHDKVTKVEGIEQSKEGNSLDLMDSIISLCIKVQSLESEVSQLKREKEYLRCQNPSQENETQTEMINYQNITSSSSPHEMDRTDLKKTCNILEKKLKEQIDINKHLNNYIDEVLSNIMKQNPETLQKN